MCLNCFMTMEVLFTFTLLLIGACARILCSDNRQPLVPIQVNFPMQDLIRLCSVQSKELADLVTVIFIAIMGFEAIIIYICFDHAIVLQVG